MPIFSTLAASAGAIGTAALLGAGGVAAATAAKPKARKLPAMPGMPTPTSAEETARAELEKQRRIRALAGGKTLLTSEGIGATGAGLKTLLGD